MTALDRALNFAKQAEQMGIAPELALSRAILAQFYLRCAELEAQGWRFPGV